jgi:transposase
MGRRSRSWKKAHLSSRQDRRYCGCHSTDQACGNDPLELPDHGAEYKRNGTTTLFAALDTLEGKVVGECHQRHRHQEFLRFLRRINAEFPGDVPLHLVMDNYGTHKHAKVKAWLKWNPRFVSHFVPTSSSWLNLVERWFGHLDNKAIRRGVFLSVPDLEASIEAFIKAWNQNPQPFVWTATVESIQEKLSRCRRTLEQIKPGCTRPKTRKRK